MKPGMSCMSGVSCDAGNLLSWFKDSKSKTPLGYLKIDHIEWIDYHFNRPTELTFIALQPNKVID